ncbi:hypothetical protein PZH32_13085, partial [Adlercreutzia equolifaciens]|nr:hypothetical protein [Adlercreutzia equolifaciens]
DLGRGEIDTNTQGKPLRETLAANAFAGGASVRALDIPLFICAIDIAAEAERTHENVEAVARRERYLAANEALRSMCQHEGCPLSTTEELHGVVGATLGL